MRNRVICKVCKVELETRHSRSIKLCEDHELD